MEQAPPPGFDLSSLIIRNENGIAAASPLFRTNYQLSTTLPRVLRRAMAWVERVSPRLTTLPVVGIGSPVMDHCAVGYPPTASTFERTQAFSALIDGLETEAEATGAHLMAVKDVGDSEASWADPVLHSRRYARIASLPIAVLDLPFSDVEQYLQSLTASTRRNLRQKIRASATAVSFEETSSASGLVDEIAQLYQSTRANSKAAYGEFDDLSPEYVQKVVEDVEGATLLLGRVDGNLASFALILTRGDTAFAHQLGMRYPVARANNLYFLNWIETVRYCIDRGISRLEFGQTSYPIKLRLGCRLEPSWIYFRHRVRPIHAAMRYIAPRFGFDRMEPIGCE